jgi:hypothetical protein
MAKTLNYRVQSISKSSKSQWINLENYNENTQYDTIRLQSLNSSVLAYSKGELLRQKQADLI